MPPHGLLSGPVMKTMNRWQFCTIPSGIVPTEICGTPLARKTATTAPIRASGCGTQAGLGSALQHQDGQCLPYNSVVHGSMLVPGAGLEPA